MYTKGIIIILALVYIFSFAGCTANVKGDYTENSQTAKMETTKEYLPSADNTSIYESEWLPEKIIDNMTLDEKIGQMFIVGIDGYAMDENANALIGQNHIGGIILFGGNIKSPNQLLSLINSLKQANSKNKVPLFISVDQEGGRIDRMPAELVRFPTNEVIGNVNNISFSYNIGKALAGEIKAFGFNMDFAPVLDVNSNPDNPVINNRSFGPDPVDVSNLGEATMKGIQANGIIPVVKHFPGHGDTSVDSHKGLPVVDHDMERLKKLELIPFKNAISKGADAAMVAHILMNKLDSKNPATLSKKVITGLLREELGFEGVVVTDDMTMGAIIKNYKIGDAIVKSVAAGCDLILVCHKHENELDALQAMKKAVEDGIIPESRIDESVKRILNLKYKYKLKDEAVEAVDIDKINKNINSVVGEYLNQNLTSTVQISCLSAWVIAINATTCNLDMK